MPDPQEEADSREIAALRAEVEAAEGLLVVAGEAGAVDHLLCLGT